MASNVRIGDRVSWLAPDDFHYEAVVVEALANDLFSIEVGGPEGWRVTVFDESLWIVEFGS